MTPAHPPLPTASYLPFQPVMGSQTSTLISESLVGASVAITRQNAGKPAYGLGAAPPLPFPLPLASPVPAGGAPLAFAGGGGATNAPGAIVCAMVIIVFGSFCDAMLSHEAAIAGITGIDRVRAKMSV